MGQPVLSQFTTQADTSGTDKLKLALKSVEYQTKTTGATMSSAFDQADTKYNSLSRGMGRPLGRLAFAGIAQEITMSSGAMTQATGATAALQRGFMSLGSGLMWFNPILGGIGLGISGLIALFVKLTRATGESAENIKKQVDVAMGLKKSYDEAAKTLLEYNVITSEQAKILKEGAADKQKEIDAIKSGTLAKSNEAEASYKKMKADLELFHGEKNLIYYENTLGPLREKSKNLLLALAGMTTFYSDKQKTSAESTKEAAERETELSKVRFEMNLKAAVGSNDLETVNRKLKESQDEVNQSEYDYIIALKDGDKASIESAKKRVDDANYELSAVTAAKSKLQSVEKKDSALAISLAHNTASAITTAMSGGKDAQKNILAQMGADMIQSVAKFACIELEIKAAKDLSNPLTVPIGLAELAAIAAIQGIAGGIAGSISSGASTSSSPTVSSNAGGVGGGGQSGNPISVTIQLQGGNLNDPGTIAVIGKSLNKFVATNNGAAVMTNIVTR